MAEKRDYYEVLGVQKNATDEEIKRAYRRKAKECHPDLHPGDKDAEARFKELNEANEVLSDPDKRARYDQFGFNDPMAGGNPFAGGSPFSSMDFGDLGDILNQAFGMGGMGGTARRNAPRQGNDLPYDLYLTFEEAARGCKKKIEFYRYENCSACHGTGAKPGTQPQTCPTCRGTGQVRSGSGIMFITRTCPTCGGTGKSIAEKCPNCGGAGRTRVRRSMELNIPAGVDTDINLVKRGEGEPGVNGGPNGDLYIHIIVRPHKMFKRDGNNLYLEVPISFTQAALGAEIDIPTLDGAVKYAIPEGTQNDDEFRIKDHGIPRMNSSGKGDLIFRVRVEIPRRLTEKQRELLRQFDENSTGREYEQRKSFFDKVRDIFN